MNQCAQTSSLFVISRGPVLAVARVEALKPKETGQLHAETFSAVELRHGPAALAGSRMTVVALLPNDQSCQSVIEAAGFPAARCTEVFLAGEMSEIGRHIPAVQVIDQVLSSICMAASM